MLNTAIGAKCDPQTIVLTGAATDEERRHAAPIKRILDRNSQELVGWLYEWNTGDQVPMWINGRKSDVIYEQYE